MGVYSWGEALVQVYILHHRRPKNALRGFKACTLNKMLSNTVTAQAAEEGQVARRSDQPQRAQNAECFV